MAARALSGGYIAVSGLLCNHHEMAQVLPFAQLFGFALFAALVNTPVFLNTVWLCYSSHPSKNPVSSRLPITSQLSELDPPQLLSPAAFFPPLCCSNPALS